MGAILEDPCVPDWRALRACIMREAVPSRVHHIELFLDGEIQNAVCARFGLDEDLDPGDPYYPHRRQIAIQRFLGYDYVRWSLDPQQWPLNYVVTEDSADLAHEGGRSYVDMKRGPITTWEEFEAYPWPDAHEATTSGLEWFSANLPEDMCIMGSGGFAHFAEHLGWLMGYETCCIALCEAPDLVGAIAQRLLEYYQVFIKRMLEFDVVKFAWGSDDMGFRTGLLFPPGAIRQYVLAGHKEMARISHAAGRPYLLHSCGNLEEIMDELIDDVGIDAKHSFEDTIMDVRDAYRKYGDRVTILGGIDMDFLCRATEAEVRQRVRDTLEVCQPGGGYCLGTGNSVANYVPVGNYLAMLDEGRRYRG